MRQRQKIQKVLRKINKMRGKLNLKVIILTCLVVLAAAILLYSYFIEPNKIQIIQYEYENKNTPESLRGFRIGFISDLHCDTNARPTSEAAALLQKQDTDLLLIGGDFIDTKDDNLEKCLGPISQLKVRHGIFTVFGNHDNKKKHKSSVRQITSKLGIKSLENDSVWVEEGGARIKIGGVGDFWTGTQNTEKIEKDVEESDTLVLLSHSPDYFPKVGSNKKIDIMLSGHLHGGQVGVFGWYPVVPSKYGDKYRFGRFDENGKSLFVTKGIGENLLPFRFMAPPDIMVIEL